LGKRNWLKNIFSFFLSHCLQFTLSLSQLKKWERKRKRQIERKRRKRSFIQGLWHDREREIIQSRGGLFETCVSISPVYLYVCLLCRLCLLKQEELFTLSLSYIGKIVEPFFLSFFL
jgi:hypothetical protein